MMMKFRDVRVFCFLLLFVLGSSATWESRANCPNSCGNITLYFPFGTSGCAYDERFLIRCNEVENTTFLVNGNLQVTDLSLQGEIQTLMPVYHHCHNTSGEGMVSSLVSTDFTFSSKNRMTIVGCGVGILAQGVRESVYGCATTCNSSETITRPCSGHDGCCQTPIPSGANTLSLDTFSLTDARGCFSIFIVRDGDFNFSAQEDLKNLRNVTSFPVTLDWVINNKTCPPAGEAGSCGKKSICTNSTTASGGSGFSCKCQPGYEGNPYLGCQDIDECKRTKHSCQKDETCQNIAGSFHCKKSKEWKIILLGSIIGFLIFLLGVCGIKLKLEKQKTAKVREKRFEDNGGLMLVQRLLDWGAQSSKPCIKILSDEEIKVATNNFDETRILGKGGQGIVYHGTLSDKTEVAIKKARVGERDQVAQFINEIVLLSQIDHPHVVNLLCCCLETEIPLLVYEYVSGGTLYDNLLGSCLPWEDRLRIAAEIAQTLLYLHSYSPTPIVHRDVKPSNVLLDDKLSAKVSDFGASRLLPADREDLRKTLVQGTFAYLDPEYMQTRTLSEKSDIYSYGVLLMELVTGEKVLCSNRPQEHLVALLETALQEDRLDEVLDTRVVNADNRREIYEAALLAIRCTSVKGQERPTMTEIVAQLQVLSPRDCHVGPTSVDSGVAAEIPT